MEISPVCISKVLCFIWSTSHWEGIIDSKRTPSSRNRTRRNTWWYIHWCAALQTATVDVNHIHKVRYFVQLSVVLKYTCLKKAHKASNSVLPLISWVEERSLSSRMFKCWMLIMKFQINYLVFIRSMREGNFKLFVKILISLVKWFFIFDHYNYARWLFVHIQYLLSLPITCPQLYQEFEKKNFVVQISSREFSRIHYVMTKLTNKTTRQLSLSKGQSISWMVHAIVTEKVGDCRAQNFRIFRASWEQNTERYQQKWHPSPWG